ncbi:MAG: hypothetical protein U5J63_11905 [Fodinibius sp.]|nr:hypothetical protein [Fodinibius sp.]
MFEHYPEWARELAQKYLSRTINQFILHGNVHDLVPLERQEGMILYGSNRFCQKSSSARVIM